MVGAMLPGLMLSTGCASLPGMSAFRVEDDSGLGQVDQLMREVEGLHLAAERAGDAAHLCASEMAAMVGGGGPSNPIEAYQVLVEHLEASERQSAEMRSRLAPLRGAAEAVHGQWSADLETIGIASLRERSRERLTESRERIAAIDLSAESALVALDVYNDGLRDLATFLGHDYNPSSLAGAGQEIQLLSGFLAELDRRIANCLQACEAHVMASGMPERSAAMMVEEPAPDETL